MSELIDNARERKKLLKHMISELHSGTAPDAVRAQLVRLLGRIPYSDVVEVEQELISEGLPVEEVLRLCDVHTEALRGAISQEGVTAVPPGHPVHTFMEENRALRWQLDALTKLYGRLDQAARAEELETILDQVQIHFNALADVEKHYRRKENLLFPFLEKHGITGPPKVMWGKHDEARELLAAAHEALRQAGEMDMDEARSIAGLILRPASDAIGEMIHKEQEILFPLCLDALTETEWYSIYSQSIEIGFCLFDPADEWRPAGEAAEKAPDVEMERIQLPSGSFTPGELTAILNTLPFDLTFVDKDDTVRYFTQGRERIFDRNRAILGRKVQLCHPPSSVRIVQKILDDFRAGRHSRAPFWINLRGRFIHIEYYALRDAEGAYLGTLEVSQDLTEKRGLEGEQRLISYGEE